MVDFRGRVFGKCCLPRFFEKEQGLVSGEIDDWVGSNTERPTLQKAKATKSEGYELCTEVQILGLVQNAGNTASSLT